MTTERGETVRVRKREEELAIDTRRWEEGGLWMAEAGSIVMHRWRAKGTEMETLCGVLTLKNGDKGWWEGPFGYVWEHCRECEGSYNKER